MYNGRYLVYMLRDTDQCSNVVRALAYYRRVLGGYWPARVLLHKYSRIRIRFGSGTEVLRHDGAAYELFIDGVYMDAEQAYPYASDVRTPVVLGVGRCPLYDEAFLERRRNYESLRHWVTE